MRLALIVKSLLIAYLKDNKYYIFRIYKTLFLRSFLTSQKSVLYVSYNYMAPFCGYRFLPLITLKSIL